MYDSNPNARELTIGRGMSIQGFKYLKDFVYGLQPAITKHNVNYVSTMNEQFNIPSITTNLLVYRLSNATNANEIMQVLASGRVLKRKVECSFVFFLLLFLFHHKTTTHHKIAKTRFFLLFLFYFFIFFLHTI